MEVMEKGQLRVWAGEKGEWANIGVMVYGERLPGGESVEVVRKRLVREIQEMLNTHFGSYSYVLSPKAREWSKDD